MSGGPTGQDEATRALEQFQGIKIPSIYDQQIDLAGPEYIGDYEAALQAAIAQDPSQMEGIAIDPRLRDAQLAALDQISQMGETGLLPGEKAALDQARRAAAGEAQAKSAQLLDEFARRGMGGSGAELAARLQAGQSSADRLSQEGDRIAQMAQERALNAITQKGNLAGNIRGQEFGEQSDIARAQDAINQFNTANKQQVQAANVGATNQANLRNLSEKQRVGEARTGIDNQQELYNKQLIQQRFQNEMQRAAGIAGQHNQIAQAQQQAAANQANMAGNIVGAGGAVLGAYLGGPTGAAAGYQAGRSVGAGGASYSDKKGKTNIKDMDMSDFLDDLTAKKYDYKDPNHGEGKHVGVMAQDVEIEMPQMVEDTPEGKVIKTDKAIGPILASLADLHERLKQFEGE